MKTTVQRPSIRPAANPTDWRDAATLLREYAEWIKTATTFDPFAEQPSFADELHDLAGHYSSRDAVLLIARLRERAVGTLALTVHPGGDAELKRMYVRPNARGVGIADTLLAAALALAAHRQCTHTWLETVRGAMDPAISVYRRNGFSIVEDGHPTIDVTGVVVMRRDEMAATGDTGRTGDPPR